MTSLHDMRTQVRHEIEALEGQIKFYTDMAEAISEYGDNLDKLGNTGSSREQVVAALADANDMITSKSQALEVAKRLLEDLKPPS